MGPDVSQVCIPFFWYEEKEKIKKKEGTWCLLLLQENEGGNFRKKEDR